MLEFISDPKPVDSISSVMGTTWSFISWSAPSNMSILYYEIKYNASQSDNCSSMVMNLNSYHSIIVSSIEIYTNVTGLTANTFYCFAVRTYTVNGYGEWSIFANRTLLASMY